LRRGELPADLDLQKKFDVSIRAELPPTCSGCQLMSSSRSPMKDGPEVWAIVSLPPPVTGMSLLTEKVVRRLQAIGPVKVLDFATGDSQPRLHTRALRVLRGLRCLAVLVAHGPVRDGRLYLTANSRGGLLLTGLLVKAARRLGYTVHLHHHVYNYIVARDRTMAWIDRSMTASDCHLVHAPQMMRDFQAQYASPCRFQFLYPSIVSLPLGEPRHHIPAVARLGFLSNLSVAKGLDLVLDTFRKLQTRGRHVHLCLAGPCATAEAERMIRAATDEFKGTFCYVGPVDSEQKLDFFRSIDCFLFPTRLESWGIVLNESLASGVPVITNDRGCIRTLVGSLAGAIASEPTQFVETAVHQIEAWIDSPADYSAASLAALAQAEALHREAVTQLEVVAAGICAPAQAPPR
jgi:glycosyltransferase involved in cell wall biosynthesis